MSPAAHTVLRASRSAVERHWGLLLNKMHRILPKTGEKYWIEPSALRGTTGDLMCRRYAAERASRDLGVDVPIVPLIGTRNEPTRYWLSLHQSWAEPADPRSQNFVYHTTSITVFFGKEASREKMQLFRAEWPGLRIRLGGNVEFEAPGAGHPHWQFDAYQQHIRETKAEQQRLNDLEQLLNEELPEAEDFADTVIEKLSSEEESERVARMQRLTKMHFASSTRWARSPWDGDRTSTESHASAPTDLSEALNWITSTLVYIQHEIAR